MILGVERDQKINYLWGGGSTAVAFLESYPGMLFDAVIESSPAKKEFFGYTVFSPDEVELDQANIYIASEFYEEIREAALKKGANPSALFSCQNMMVDSSDAVVISYQKCGRTWLRMMLGRVYQKYFSLPENEVLRITESPFRFQAEFPAMPKVVFHHDDNAHRKMAYELNLSKSIYRYKKVVFLVRDPRDVVVSNYYHMTYRARSNNLNISDFVRKYFLSIIGFYNAWANSFVFDGVVVRYEDIKKNEKKELSRILSYIDPSLVISESALNEAINYCSLENMTKYEQQGKFSGNALAGSNGERDSSKVRKGKVGGFREEIDLEVQRFCDWCMDSLDPRYGYK